MYTLITLPILPTALRSSLPHSFIRKHIFKIIINNNNNNNNICCCQFTFSLYILLSAPLLVTPSHNPSPIPSPLFWAGVCLHPTLTMTLQVSARLVTCSPSETTQGSPASRAYPNYGNSFLDSSPFQFFKTHMKVKLLSMSREAQPMCLLYLVVQTLRAWRV